MQCVSCGFENIPGLQLCARCQSSLLLGDIDVKPPRASGSRMVTRGRRLWYRIRNGLGTLISLLPRWRPVVYHAIPFATLLRCLIPGWVHIRSGRRVFGWVLLTAWLWFLFLALLTIGTGFSQFWLALACLVHTFVIVAVWGNNLLYEGLPIRVLASVFVFLGAWYFLYGSITWFGGRFYEPLAVEGIVSSRLLKNDDVILHEGPWRRPEHFQRGEIVLYRMQSQWGGNGLHGGYIYGAIDGQCVDRVIGLPGEHIEARKGRLLVDGQALPENMYPLAGLSWGWSDGLDVQLASAEYLIIPSIVRIPGPLPPNTRLNLGNLARVASVEIVGRVVLRVRPYSRFGRLK